MYCQSHSQAMRRLGMRPQSEHSLKTVRLLLAEAVAFPVSTRHTIWAPSQSWGMFCRTSRPPIASSSVIASVRGWSSRSQVIVAPSSSKVKVQLNSNSCPANMTATSGHTDTRGKGIPASVHGCVCVCKFADIKIDSADISMLKYNLSGQQKISQLNEMFKIISNV